MKRERINILLIEDDKDDYLLLKTYASKLDMQCNIEWASTYEKGLEAVKKKSNYDLCFVDYHLGAHNGVSFIKEVKNLNLPQGIIMLTGQGDDEVGIQAMRVGADDYYNKNGLNTETLNRAIRFTLERKRNREQEKALILAQAERKLAEKQKIAMSKLLEELQVIEERLNLAQKAGNIGTYEWAFNRKKVLWTEELEKLYGLKKGEYDGTYEMWKTMIHPEDLKATEEALENALQTRTPFSYEFRIKLKDGKIRWILAKGDIFYDKNDKPIRMVGVNIDITERKKLERQKDDFLAIASHELKTPVTSIKAFTQVLASRFAKQGDEQATVLLQKMDGQINKLTALINDLLDVTKIEGGKLQFNQEFFYFDELVSEVIEEVQRTTQKHKLTIHGRTEKTIFGDRDRVGQVITNFLTNAIKYSPDSNKIIIKTSSNKSHVTLSVQDFGVGIPKDKQLHVFERFYRVHGETHDTVPGIGLGLYISSEIIRRQNGEIWIESDVGKGSTFSFKLPIHKIDVVKKTDGIVSTKKLTLDTQN